MTRVLGLGVATLDIINSVDQYPLEDQKLRSNSRNRKRGGNAANTLVILSQLGYQCAFAGTLANAPDTNVIRKDFNKHNVDISHCPISISGSTPTSYITLSETNGSRTILHYRDLREFTNDDFLKIDLSGFDWIHFEGRVINETHQMLTQTKKTYPAIPVSLEVEKPRDNIESLFQFADTLFFSQSYAAHFGFNDAESFILQTHKKHISKELVCTWGHNDSVAINNKGKLTKCQTYPPEIIIDTIAAGDTFNAGFIDAKLRKLSLSEALESANKLAGKKCGQLGLDQLV